jgi:membrane associated rhomboid family serine protease
VRVPQSWSRARLTLVILAVTVAAWLIAVTFQREEWIALWGGFIPARLAFGDQGMTFAPFWLTPLTSALIHAGFLHLLFNMLVLIVCGRPVESVLGPASLAILYLLGAYAAAAAQYATGPTSATVMVGASGAISAVLGAYAMLFGRNKVKVANPRLALWLNALWLLAAWVALQAIVGIISGQYGLEIAVAAHIGGFLVGIILAWPLLRFRYRNA